MHNYNKQPIDDKFLGRNDLFGLEFNNGLVFLQVTGWEEQEYKPFTGIGQVGANSDSGFQRLEDPDNDDILYIDSGETKVLHASIGQKPARVRRYTNYPEGENRLRTIPNLGVPRPSNGDDYGYVDGDASPYDNPSEAQELVIPPGTHLDFNFFNPDKNDPVNPKLNIKMREYNVRVLRPGQNGNTISRILSPGSPMPVYPVGSIDNQTGIGKLESDWRVNPVSRSDIRNGRV